MVRYAICLAALAATISVAQAAPIDVTAVGENGWNSTDTRVANVNATTPVDIASRIQFVDLAGTGAVQLLAPASNDKATIAYVDTNGLGGLAGFTAEYRWYKDGPVGAPAPALKLGIQTSDFVAGPASRIGEENWDKVLIYEPYDNPDAASTPVGTWVTQTISASSGTWWMFSRQGSITGAINPPHSSLTLNQWLADGTWGTKLSGGSIVDVQLGVGSGNAGSIGYVDYLETSVLNGGDRIDFGVAVVPEPSTLALAGLGIAGLVGYGRRRNRVAK